jgi:membrane protein
MSVEWYSEDAGFASGRFTFCGFRATIRVMARLGDVPVVLRRVGMGAFLKRLWQQIGEDNVFTWGAALAYSWLFAVFPFLIFLLSLVPLIPDWIKPDIEADVGHFADTTLPKDAADVVREQVKGVMTKGAATGAFRIVGIVLTIWAASGGMSMTMQALDKAYDIDKGRPFYKQRPIAVGLTIVVATLVILVMILLPIGTLALRWLISQQQIWPWLAHLVNIVRYVIALGMLFAILALIYYFGPSFRHKFQAITPGAVFTIGVWLLLGYLFKLYLTQFGGAESYNRTYGAVAGAAILLLFFYIDALVLLVGAEINSEIDFAMGEKPALDESARQAGAVPHDDAIVEAAQKLKDNPVPQPSDPVKQT